MIYESHIFRWEKLDFRKNHTPELCIHIDYTGYNWKDGACALSSGTKAAGLGLCVQ